MRHCKLKELTFGIQIRLFNKLSKEAKEEKMKKYKILEDGSIKFRGKSLCRIQALIDFADVKAGDIGGYVESEENLSHEGEAWVYDNAIVCDDARVFHNAKVRWDAKVFDHAKVYYEAEIHGSAEIYGNAEVFCDAYVEGNAKIYGNAEVYDYAEVHDYAEIFDNAKVSGKACICSCTEIYGNAKIYEKSNISGDAKIYGNAAVFGNAEVCDDVEIYGNAEVYGEAKIYGSAKISNREDYIVFKNSWSSGRYFTYTRSNKMWQVGCFYGTSEELVKKAYEDSELSGKNYSLYVELVKNLEKNLESNN